MDHFAVLTPHEECWT